MKYLYFITISLFGIFYKISGLVMFYLVAPFSQYLRNTIHNYDLQNNQVVKRLNERQLTLINDYLYYLEGYEVKGGYIIYKKVSKLKYYICLPFWCYLDDDASNCTYSRGHNLQYVNGERYAPKFIVDRLETKVINASYFEVGDKQIKEFNLFGAIIWNGRNTGYNFNYKFFQMSDDSKVFYFKFLGLEFGWVEDGVVNGVKYYKHILGYNF